MELQSSLGLCNVLRQFVPIFAQIMDPLSGKRRKCWACVYRELPDEELKAVESLGEKLISPPVLGLQGSQGTYSADTDGCKRQVGWVILQNQPDRRKKPISYRSRSLTDSEFEYDTTL